jgi:hypothetical protein
MQSQVEGSTKMKTIEAILQSIIKQASKYKGR